MEQIGDPGFAGVEFASLVALGAAGAGAAGAGARWMVRVVAGTDWPPLVAGSTAGAAAGAIAGEFVSESACRLENPLLDTWMA